MGGEKANVKNYVLVILFSLRRCEPAKENIILKKLQKVSEGHICAILELQSRTTPNESSGHKWVSGHSLDTSHLTDKII